MGKLMILPDDRGVPQPYTRDGQKIDLSLSISHTAHCALAAAVALPLCVGADVERLIGNAEMIAKEYFASSELATFWASQGAARVRYATDVWVVKEAVLKAIGEGLRLPLTGVVLGADRDPSGEGFWRVSVGPPDFIGPCLAWLRHDAQVSVGLALRGEGIVGMDPRNIRIVGQKLVHSMTT